MHICHVNLASGFSGGERQTLTLIQQQAQMGYQLTAVVNPKSQLLDELRAIPQCQIVLCPHYTRQHGRSITATCDLIHVHEGRAIYWALFQHLLHRVPYIVTRRIDNPLKKKWLSQLAYRKASALVGLSSEIIHQLEKRHPDAKLVKIPSSPVTYPVSQDKVEQINAHFRGKFLVIHAANMYAHKGFDVTIEAARLLADTSPDIQFCLLGDGKERDALEAQAQGLTNVQFMGKQANMGDWFAAADLLVHPSYTEGLGSVILEAMAAGLPVIGARAGGIPDIIEDSISGYLITPGDSASLAARIHNISKDDVTLSYIKENSETRIGQFGISECARKYEVLYKEVKD
ncbi:glycosyl transferase [Salinivibrio siamensis]|uniref:Glycosyltransferase family 4 protein n=2 Tax=Salinivibrio TaxID=51366 RepID=A0AA47LRI5_9GAMM|nr:MULTISPECIES: glycosyltransferase family 4 protein [Salinivibrio]OOE87412.1 glycosyl transferase [Salinivibrio siamensis]WBA08794.1 glycosyltransferase family 4 protein [Salinivibrio kushneri]